MTTPSHSIATDTVRFFVNGEYHEVVAPMPTTTILEYVREKLLLTGSKEGCAEGDCGACTVAIAELVGDGYRLRTVNSCIQFLPTLDGKELITVEGLKDSQGQLHPAQKAMVECHGSQCGFCTPGFVMSLFFLYRTQTNPSRQDINHALAGNLCRCTGYRPIVAAAAKMYTFNTNERDCKYGASAPNESDLLQRLRGIKRDHTLDINNRQRYFAPTTLDELCRLIEQHPEATILAGGTDVGLWVTKQFRSLPQIIYVGDVAELNLISNTDTHIQISAGVGLTYAFEILQQEFPGLTEVIRRFASPPICNAGTLVGNVANGSPIGDSMPALMCLGATVVLRKGNDERETSLDDFYLGYQKTALEPGEFVLAIRVPKSKPDTVLRSYKLSKRFDQDISAVCGAYRVQLLDGMVKEIDICYGGLAAIPKRARKTEQALKGKVWNEGSVIQAIPHLSDDFSPISDMRAGADYRKVVAGNLLLKFFHDVEATHADARVFSVDAS